LENNDEKTLATCWVGRVSSAITSLMQVPKKIARISL
jgi:hypothetical protein